MSSRLTLEQASKEAHCSAESLRLAIADGTLRAYKPPSHRRFLIYVDDLDNYIRSYPVKKCDSTNAVKSGGAISESKAVEEALKPQKKVKPQPAPAPSPPVSGSKPALAYSR